jgi:hypothetical protein
MATKFVTKDVWDFQYILDDTKPFYASLKDDTKVTISATAIVEETVGHPNVGNTKTIFPGGNATADDALY